jgi:hypothetical protein
MEETHKGKNQKPHPKLIKEKVNKSKLGNKLIKAIAPSSQRKANNKTNQRPNQLVQNGTLVKLDMGKKTMGSVLTKIPSQKSCDFLWCFNLIESFRHRSS